MPHHGAGEHSVRSSVQSVQSEQQRGGEGPGAQQYRVIAPQAPLPLAFGNDAEAEVDAEQRYARGAAHVGQLEQVSQAGSKGCGEVRNLCVCMCACVPQNAWDELYRPAGRRACTMVQLWVIAMR